jgi:leucyl-tRNA synthetase
MKKIIKNQKSKDSQIPLYVLAMWPYPSGNPHMGHLRAYAIVDVFCRYLKLNKISFFQPIGFDALGLPADNAAKEHWVCPRAWTENNIQSIKKCFKEWFTELDWNTEISTYESRYAIFQQELFVKLYNAGLVYRRKELMNYDPVDDIFLANEQAIDGIGWRSGAKICLKFGESWYFAINKYCQNLYDNLTLLKSTNQDVTNLQRHLGWSNAIIEQQRNWLGPKTAIAVGEGIVLRNNKPVDRQKAVLHCDIKNPGLLSFMESKVIEEYATEILHSKGQILSKITIAGFPVILSIGETHSVDYMELVGPDGEYGIKEGYSITIWHVRDWSIARKRIWGCPIPAKFVNNGWRVSNDYIREVMSPCPDGQDSDTMDTFVDSSFYNIFFCLDNNQIPRPVAYYFGGAEHACLHLLYARFMWLAMKSVGYDLPGEEPFLSLVNQGMILAPAYFRRDKHQYVTEIEANLLKSQGITIEVQRETKMGKSKKNGVAPIDLISKYGIDAVTLAILSDSPIDQTMIWIEDKIVGPAKLIKKMGDMKPSLMSKLSTAESILLKQLRLNMSIMAYHKAIALLHTACRFAKHNGISRAFYRHIMGIFRVFCPIRN